MIRAALLISLLILVMAVQMVGGLLAVAGRALESLGDAALALAEDDREGSGHGED